MNKVIQYFFLAFLPFYPIMAWLSYSMTKRDISIFAMLIFMPILFYYLLTERIRVPKYLILFIIFTIYHFISIFANNLVPPNMNMIFYILSDSNLLACIVLLVVENTHFDDEFLKMMNKMILIVVLITLAVSVIQIKFNTFFISPELSENPRSLIYLQQHRNFSIFSWININSLGVSFPILIALLLGFNEINKKSLPLIMVSGIVVAFLSKARYVMISTVIVISQLFFVKKLELSKKIYILLLIAGLSTALIVLANAFDVNVQQVITNRIMERSTGFHSAKARLESLVVFLQVFPENPWFGVGPETRLDVLQLLRGITTSIHVGYLSYLYFYGIIGCLFLFASMFLLLRDSWIVGKKSFFWGSYYGLLSFFFANITFVYFNFSEMGIVLAVLYMRYFKERITREVQIKKVSSEPEPAVSL